jgi:hypothetical protein
VYSTDGGFEDSELSSPSYCSPLAMINPNTCTGQLVEYSGKDTVELSHWVKRHYKGFCRLVGFPIDSHEQQCLALLQRIEANRFQHRGPSKLKQKVGSARKGVRELRNLVSSINYDGRPTDC